jgi:hypothetical protein
MECLQMDWKTKMVAQVLCLRKESDAQQHKCQSTNCCPTSETLWKLKFDVNDSSSIHSRYHPSYHLLGPLKEVLRGRQFNWDQEVKEVVHGQLTAQPKMFLSEGIGKLVQRWTKHVEKQGTMLKDYVNVSFLFVLK